MGRIFTDEEADAAPAAKPARRVFTDAEADAHSAQTHPDVTPFVEKRNVQQADATRHDIPAEMLEGQRRIADGVTNTESAGAGLLSRVGMSGPFYGGLNKMAGGTYDEGHEIGEAKEFVAKHDKPVPYAGGALLGYAGMAKGLRAAGEIEGAGATARAIRAVAGGPAQQGALMGGAEGVGHGRPAEALSGAVVGGTLGALAGGAKLPGWATRLTGGEDSLAAEVATPKPNAAALMGAGVAGYAAVKADNPGDRLTAGLMGAGAAGGRAFDAVTGGVSRYMADKTGRQSARAEAQVRKGVADEFVEEQAKIADEHTKGLDAATAQAFRTATVEKAPQNKAHAEALRVNAQTDKAIEAQRAAHGEEVHKNDQRSALNAKESLGEIAQEREAARAKAKADYDKAMVEHAAATAAAKEHAAKTAAAQKAVQGYSKERRAVAVEKAKADARFAQETEQIAASLEELQGAKKELTDSANAKWAKKHADLSARIADIESMAKSEGRVLAEQPRLNAMKKYLLDTRETWTGPKLKEGEEAFALGKDKWVEKQIADDLVANQNERGALEERAASRVAPTRADAEKAVAEKNAPYVPGKEEAAEIAAFAEKNGIDASDLQRAIQGDAPAKTAAPVVPPKPVKAALPPDTESAEIKQNQIERARHKIDAPEWKPTNVTGTAAAQERADFPGFREGPASSMQPVRLKFNPPEPPPTFTPEQEQGIIGMRSNQAVDNASHEIRGQYASQGVENPSIVGRYLASQVPLVSHTARGVSHLIHAATGRKPIASLSERMSAGGEGFQNPAEAAAVMREVAPAVERFAASRGTGTSSTPVVAGIEGLDALLSDPETREKIRAYLAATQPAEGAPARR